MNSFNHFGYGAIGDWLHRVVGGLAPAEPGYRPILIAPRPGGGLTWAATRHHTPYGLAESSWRITATTTGSSIDVAATVPPNTTAIAVLPGRDNDPIEVGAGKHRWHYNVPPRPGDGGPPAPSSA
jgi:alpha-L-rhamnosidase